MDDDRLFYKNLEAFHEFSELTGNAPFVSVPDSWSVLITDIKGSTQAVKEGRSKDINLIGAASITCVLNATDASEIPFVFGGDGATLLVPTHVLEKVVQELKGLQDLAKKSFKLD